MSSQPTYSNPDCVNTLNRKAVALISGGLDSALAIQLIKSQGIEITALHFLSFFTQGDPTADDSPVSLIARQLEVPLIFRERGDDFLDIVRNPRYGHGKNINPCIDCRIYSLIKAKEVMHEIGASFLVTGEVVGQRPMSQRRDTMRLIEKRSGCEGILVRPLSAKILAPTLPEQAGILDREKLLDVAGRGRKVQLGLAAEIGLEGFSPPAGGCLLTEKVYSDRLRDLLDDEQDVARRELSLLATGRHIRVRPGLKIVVGRNKDENDRIQQLSEGGLLFFPSGFPGPVVAVQGSPSPEEERLIGSIIRRYARESARGEEIGIRDRFGEEREIVVTEVASPEWISDKMI